MTYLPFASADVRHDDAGKKSPYAVALDLHRWSFPIEEKFDVDETESRGAAAG